MVPPLLILLIIVPCKALVPCSTSTYFPWSEIQGRNFQNEKNFSIKSQEKRREEKKKLKRPKKFSRENGRKNSNTGFEKRKILFLARASLTATQVHTPDTPEITTPFVSVETSMVSSRGLATLQETVHPTIGLLVRWCVHYA